jgi:hypothetical protein
MTVYARNEIDIYQEKDEKSSKLIYSLSRDYSAVLEQKVIVVAFRKI